MYAEVVGEVNLELLKSKLVKYKIPKIFTVDSIKRKGQGKINRKDLYNDYTPKIEKFDWYEDYILHWRSY